jgi:predicted helicase
MAPSAIDVYRRQIEKELQAGNATEGSHRPALKALLESLYPGITATNEPKRLACGAPDFIITRKGVPLGHIETKDVGTNLDEMEHGKGPSGEQFIRYRDGLPNWVLTDYLEYRWYVAGERRLRARLAELDTKGKLRATVEGQQELSQLLDAFIRQEAPTVGTAKDLAERMAGTARLIRDLIIGAFEQEKEKRWLHNWLAAFREVLIPDLTESQFADMFAQTLAYGLFAAKVHAGPGKEFSRESAAFNLPKTNPFLRKLFSEIAGVDMPEAIDWAVDEIVELLKHAALVEILKDFGKGTGKHDPVVHFYETFLTAYDPKMRELRGVYYTPEAVVSYIVRSVDYLLKTRFGRSKGLADENTLILDPATGTATFLYFVIREIYEKFAGHRGAWDSYVASHLLNRVFGFELLMAPYAVAHLKLGMELQETGYAFAGDQRLGIYLTNTLEEAAKKSEQIFAKWISDEADSATQVKRDLPIMVVLGNPPYSGHSANRSEIEVHLRPGDTYSVVSGGPLPEQKVTKVVSVKKPKTIRQKTFIGHLIQDYYSVDGQPLGEKNPKWLQDDYVKFIRWGQWRIQRTGAGVLAFITNNGYLDNPTFRGMRQQLMKAFTEIYILDLHGSTKKKETALDGSPDENVFDIQQGVTLGVFIRETGKKGEAKVFHADLRGLRESKYNTLFETDITSTRWTKLSPQSPTYPFVSQDSDLLAEYKPLWKVTNAVPANVLGFQTHRDDFAIDFDEGVLRRRIDDLRSTSRTDEELRTLYNLSEDGGWKVSVARSELRSDKSWQRNFIRCLYRPFDWRACYFSDAIMDRPRRELRDQVAWRRNLCLGLGRQGLAVNDPEWYLIASSREPVDANIFRRGGINVFPLYLYPSPERGKHAQVRLGVECTRWPAGKDGRRPNLNPAFISEMEKRLSLSFVPDGRGDLKKTFGPEDVFSYIYAVLHCPTYRTRYAEFLKSDFPRIPLTSDVNLFRSLCRLGAELVALHLLESPKLSKPIARYPVTGPNFVEKGFPKYVAPGEPEPGTGTPLKAGRVYINKPPLSPLLTDEAKREARGGGAARQGQYFEGVPPEAWNFHIGGYQVCEKWLKDRRGRTLTYDDLEHYRKVVTALSETIRLMAEIDAAIPKWPML